MNRQRSITTWCVAVTVLAGMTQVAPARGAEEAAPLTKTGEALQTKYAGMLAELKKEIAAAMPAVDEKKRAAFLAAHAAVAAVPRQASKGQ